MSQLALRNNFDTNQVNAKINYATQLATAGMLPREFQANPGNVLWAIELGESLGIPAITAITGIHVMKGKPTASAGLISSLVRKAGHKLRVTGDAQSATATIIRSDDPDFEFTVTWTMQMARDAGLLANGTWKSYPEAMLKARAVTQVARDACQEALNGVQYTPEELGATVEIDDAGEQIVVTQQQRPQAPAPVVRDWLAELVAGDTVDHVLELYRQAYRGADKATLDTIAGKGKPLAEVPAAEDVDEDGVVDAEVVEDSHAAVSEQTAACIDELDRAFGIATSAEQA